MNILSKKVAEFKNSFSNQNNKQTQDSAPEAESKPSSGAVVESQKSHSIILSPQKSGELMPIASRGELVEWSPAMQSLLEEPPSKLPLQLMIGGFVFCCLFLTWAWFGKIDKIGTAQGKLIPKGETYKIESLESAKISEIDVKEGQKIIAGQAIAKLDSEQETKEVERLQEALASAQVELKQKFNLLDRVEAEGKTQQLIAQAEVRSQKLAIESALSQTKVTSELLEQQQSELEASLARERQTKELSGLDRQKLAQINSELKDHQQRLEKLKPLADAGAVSQEFIFEAKQAQRQSQQELIDSKLQGISNTNEQIFQSEQSLRDKKASMTQTQGELMQARKEYERLQAELDLKQAERYRLEIGDQQKTQQLELEINQTKTKIAETENQLEAAQDRLEKRLLKSPVAGTVIALNVANTGKVVQSGETVAEIAPNKSPLVLSAVLPDRDAGFVKKGMTAQVKFDAYSYQDYGVVPGKVIGISANTKTDEQLGSVYSIKIELDRNYISDDQQKILFKPGQTASADIVIRRLRIVDVLLEPIKKLEQDGIDL
jgi:hemolysin D